MTRRAASTGAAFAVAAAVTIAACGGGGSSTPTTPTPTPTPPPTGGGGGPTQTTITIGTNGAVSPNSVTVAVGSRVLFVNSHNRPHDMSSDPHPEHSDCPEITVGFLQPGQSRETQNLVRARTCTYHDHGEDTNQALKGTIRIQ